MLREQYEPIKNYVIGIAGFSIGITDITNIAQAVAAIGGAALVLLQLWKQLRKK